MYVWGSGGGGRVWATKGGRIAGTGGGGCLGAVKDRPAVKRVLDDGQALFKAFIQLCDHDVPKGQPKLSADKVRPPLRLGPHTALPPPQSVAPSAGDISSAVFFR